MSEKLYVTYLEYPKLSNDYNRYDGYNNPYIIHRVDDLGLDYHFGCFPNKEMLERFMTFAGLTLGEMCEDRDTGLSGRYCRWKMDDLLDDQLFTHLDSLPRGAKPFIGLSNGSLVTCYLYKEANVLHVYRPNPNYKDIYNPLPLDEHIAYCRRFGEV